MDAGDDSLRSRAALMVASVEAKLDPAVQAAADQIDAAIREAERLWPYNADAMFDDAINDRVRKALDGRLTAEEENTGVATLQPRLISANRRFAAVPLAAWLASPRRLAYQEPCDRCGRPTLNELALWLLVPAGASVVAFGCCRSCVVELQDTFRGKLRWR